MKKYIFCIMLFASLTLSLFGTEIFVYEGDSIQDAINIAVDGDIITVHEGEYVENLEIEYKSLTLRNSNWESVAGNFYPEDFIIDGGFTLGDDVINIYNCESVTIQGFSIINSGDWSDDRGIDAEDINNFEIKDCIFDNYRCSIDVWDCNNVIIENNIAYYNGDSGNKIINCFFLSNFRISNNLFNGTTDTSIAIKLQNSYNGEISYNVFNEFSHVIDFEYGLNDNENITVKCNEFNYSSSYVSNASIYTNGANNLTISENIFHYNPVADKGMSIQIWGGTNLGNYVKIENNLFKNNQSSIYLSVLNENYATVDIINNTFIGYFGVSDDEEIIHLSGLNQLNLFKNNIIYNAEIDFGLHGLNTNYITPTISYNSLGEDILAQYPNWNGGDNDIDVNPEFNNASAGDYTLSFENESPCIDGGDPDTDGDGDDWQIDEDDRDIDGSRKDMGCYPYLHDYDTKHFDEGVHWVSFPVLTSYETYVPYPPYPSIPPINYQLFQQAYYEDGDEGLLQLTYNSPGTIDGFEEILGNRYGTPMSIIPVFYDYSGGDTNFENMLFRHEGYKIKIGSVTDPIPFIIGNGVGAERLPADHIIAGSMGPGEYHWIGYWLLEPQNMIDAFGFGTENDLWQYVEKVKSEDWYYNKCSIPRGDDPPIKVTKSAKGLTMEYGKTYMVWFKDQSIENFEWYTSSTVEEPKEKAKPESFTYTEKADYEAIEVFNIPPSVIEIGVFEDEVCIGAVVVEDTCAQILVYSDYANRDPIPFTFEVVTGRGFSTSVKDYQVLDWETGKFESRSIFSGRQEYSIIRFGDDDEPEDNTLSTPQLHGNYPNPFNPTTTIEFSLVQTSQFVTLEIFNIKGQKVKTLYKGIAEEGKHSVTWEGKDTNGKSVSTGIYFYKLKTGKKEISRKMLLLK